jgi:NitT/TauT family transport system ATP-binding protein
MTSVQLKDRSQMPPPVMMAHAGGQPHIQITSAGLRYADLEVLRNVDLDIREREIVAIIGPSGCGKTSLLRCIGGLHQLTAGSISISGRPVTGPRKGVGIVFQHFGLFPWKTVFQNVAYGLRLRKEPRAVIADKVPQYIELVGLSGFENYYPHQISGGMQQRCGLARALAIEPEVMLMDEPFGAVDAQTREVLQFELLRIWGARPTTMVFVTHSIEEAVLLGDRVVLLKGQPSAICETIDIDLPKPRGRSTLAEPRFAELREHVWSTLMSEHRPT